MNTETSHITVCVCTYKRPELLSRLLAELASQQTHDAFSYSVVVADNDQQRSGEAVTDAFAASSAVPITYCVEPQRNIALVRNKSLEQARGELIAFIDDDEYPAPNWLYDLYRACTGSESDGAVGPVVPYFNGQPPKWATSGKFFEKPTRPTGSRIGDAEMRTSNVLFRREILEGEAEPFRARFGTGNEDTDFFLRMKAKGCVFVSCQEAVVYELVPDERCTRRYLLRRALHRGNNGWKHLKDPAGVVKSVIAIPAYLLALPLLYLRGEHHFLKYMMKICDHAGKLLAVVGIVPFREYK